LLGSVNEPALLEFAMFEALAFNLVEAAFSPVNAIPMAFVIILIYHIFG